VIKAVEPDCSAYFASRACGQYFENPVKFFEEILNIDLLRELRGLTEEARAVVALTVNAGLTMLYWHIGNRTSREVLSGKRGDYGKVIIATLSQ